MQAELSGGGGDVAVVVGEGGFDGGAFKLFDEQCFCFREGQATKVLEWRCGCECISILLGER